MNVTGLTRLIPTECEVGGWPPLSVTFSNEEDRREVLARSLSPELQLSQKLASSASVWTDCSWLVLTGAAARSVFSLCLTSTMMGWLAWDNTLTASSCEQEDTSSPFT